MTIGRPTIYAEPSDLMGQLLADVPKEKYNCDFNANVPFYNLPSLIGYKGHDVTKPKAPAARITGRTRGFGAFEESPGPGNYNATGATRFGLVTGVKAKLCGRQRDLTLEREVPGPGAYFPRFTLTLPSLPRPKLLGRPRDIRHDEETPGPGNYAAEPAMGVNLPRLPSSRAAGLKSRPKQIGFYAESGPGPGKYTYDLNKFLKKTPAAPLGGRGVDMFAYNDCPAPNAYFPKTNSFRPRAPAFSFGKRQSKCMTVVIEEDDNEHFVEYECQ
uniref:Outer dense fiber protein 3-B n=1 Tax=Lygus hesperus TaxID=30085 RepID=A0A0A9XDJ9_LYGHE